MTETQSILETHQVEPTNPNIPQGEQPFDPEYGVASTRITAPLARSLLRIVRNKPAKVEAPEQPPLQPRVDDTQLDEAGKQADEAVDFMSTSLDEYDTTQNWQPNFNHIQGDEDTQSLIAGLADRYSTEIDEARRGVVHDEEATALAHELGQTPEFILGVLQRKTGEPANVETILASRHVLHESAKTLKQMALQVVNGEATDRIKIAFHRQWDFHRQFMTQFMGARAEVGRAMRAYGIPLDASQNFQNKRMHEIAETMDGRFDIMQVANQVLLMDDYAGINKVVQKQAGGMSKGGAAFVEWMVGSMLSGVKTHIVNTSGNALLTAMGPVETAMATRMGWGMPKDQRMVSGEAMAQTFGLINGFNDGLLAAWKVAKTGEPYGGVAKFESAHPKALSSAELGLSGPWGWMADVAGVVARFPMERVMGSVDGFFRVLNERAKLAQLSYRHAHRRMTSEGLDRDQFLEILSETMANPPQEMLEAAVDYSIYNMAGTPLGPMGQKGQSWVNMSAPLKVVVPFIRTPTNLMKMGFVERTPLGLLSQNLRNDLASKSERAQMARARLAFGSMLAATVALYKMDGRMTGSGPSDYQARKALMATGWQPKSFVFTDEYGAKEYVSYDRMEPMSYILAMVADVTEWGEMSQYDAMFKDADVVAAEAMNALVLAVSENSLNKTFMTNARELLMALSAGPGQAGKMRNFLASNINAAAGGAGIRGDARKLMDPYMRQTFDLVDKLKDRTPFLSATLPQRLDVMGEPITYDQVMNPWKHSQESDDGLLLHMGQLMASTQLTPITMPRAIVGGVRLSAKEYHDLIVLSRKTSYGKLTGTKSKITFRRALAKEVTSREYQSMTTDEQRVAALKKIQREFDTKAQEYIKKGDDPRFAALRERIFKRKVGQHMKLHGAVATKAALENEGLEMPTF